MIPGYLRCFAMIVLAGMVSCAGCISPSPASTATETLLDSPATITPAAMPENENTAIPSPSATTALAEASATITTPVPATMTWIPKAYDKEALGNPKVELMTFTKNALSFNIPDCGMRTAFPAVAADTGYGLRQDEPALVMLPEEEIRALIRAHAGDHANDADAEKHVDRNSIGGPACAGIPANPEWNFVRINATFTPRNPRQGEYDIGFSFKMKDDIVYQLRMNRTLTIDQQVILVRYVPLKTEEMDDFESIEMVFARRG